jgi:Winged helix DNA-binding domain
MLSGRPARDPLVVVERQLAVQGQDARGARLAIRARSRGLTVADIDRAFTQDRSLLVTWLNRGTLHLVRSEDYPLLQALTTPQLVAGNRSRLRTEGVTERQAEAGVRTIVRALAAEGPLTRLQIRDRLIARGVPTERQALIHVLFRAAVRGLIVRGPIVGTQHAYVLTADWLGPLPAVDPERGLAELARRYLAGHGPASDRDLAKWAGLSLGRARDALRSIGGELERRPDGLVDLASRGRPAPPPGPKLLGAFDELLMGWTSRGSILGAADDVVVSGGVFRPFALVDGRAAATWSLPKDEVALRPIRRLSPPERRALDEEARDVRRFLGR